MLYRRAQSGFTLIELLVAISLAALMIGLINLIFNEVANAVSRGIATSRIINTSRTIGETISRDAVGMVGPGSNGILVILMKEETSVDHPDMTIRDDRYGGDVPPSAPIRSDQLLFIYDNLGTYVFSPDIPDNLDGIAPGDTNTFSPSTTTSSSPFARIWYGHVERTHRGQDGISASDLGTGAPSLRADEWWLGRQVLMLREGSSTGIHANGVTYIAPVTGYNVGDINGSMVPQLRWGITDVAYFSFDNQVTGVGSTIGPARVLVGAGGDGTYLEDGMADATYRANAYNLTFGNDRLKANPNPELNSFLSSQVAQIHPILANRVSDFAIDFAADVVDELTDGNPDNRPDTDSDGDIIWYGLDNLPPAWSYGYEPRDNASGMAHADDAYVWRHDAPDSWPYMIRIRYRLHDANGELTSGNQYRLTDGIDNDGNGVTDNNGPDPDASEAIEVGKWFEVIIPVNRS